MMLALAAIWGGFLALCGLAYATGYIHELATEHTRNRRR